MADETCNPLSSNYFKNHVCYHLFSLSFDGLVMGICPLSKVYLSRDQSARVMTRIVIVGLYNSGIMRIVIVGLYYNSGIVGLYYNSGITRIVIVGLY
jgi:hypothetical protein